MIQHLRDMIGTPDTAACLPDGRYVRAVPLPWYDGAIGRLKDAWAVFRGRAYAVEWPQPGELETVLGAELRQRHPTTSQASDE